ncbi:hypothetical protein PV326_001536, partial [Microctonus aethiopoides]
MVRVLPITRTDTDLKQTPDLTLVFFKGQFIVKKFISRKGLLFIRGLVGTAFSVLIRLELSGPGLR